MAYNRSKSLTKNVNGFLFNDSIKESIDDLKGKPNLTKKDLSDLEKLREVKKKFNEINDLLDGVSFQVKNIDFEV